MIYSKSYQKITERRCFTIFASIVGGSFVINYTVPSGRVAFIDIWGNAVGGWTSVLVNGITIFDDSFWAYQIFLIEKSCPVKIVNQLTLSGGQSMSFSSDQNSTDFFFANISEWF